MFGLHEIHLEDRKCFRDGTWDGHRQPLGGKILNLLTHV
jgi:hypothetical protein